MNKILCILMAVLALSALIDCKVGEEDVNNQHDICSIIGCVNNQHNIRNKRANGKAVAILGGVESLVTNIIKTTWDGIGKAQRRKKTIIIGPGKHNTNKVTINSRRRHY